MRDLLTSTIIQTNDKSLEEIFSSKGKIYTFLNPVSYLEAVRNKPIFSTFDGLFADGGLLVKAIKLAYGNRIERRSFDMTSLAPCLFDYCISHHKGIYIVASKQEEVSKAVELFKKQYPELKICGYRNGYFSSSQEIKQEVNSIVSVNPDFVIVGMGIIAQEKFLCKLKESGYQGIGMTCGGFVHQTANNQINYYPEWINKLNLRFLYRMYKEKHTRKRYFQAFFKFPVIFIKEKYGA